MARATIPTRPLSCYYEVTHTTGRAGGGELSENKLWRECLAGDGDGGGGGGGGDGGGGGGGGGNGGSPVTTTKRQSLVTSDVPPPGALIR